jgi:hypothetical protein
VSAMSRCSFYLIFTFRLTLYREGKFRAKPHKHKPTLKVDL